MNLLLSAKKSIENGENIIGATTVVVGYAYKLK